MRFDKFVTENRGQTSLEFLLGIPLVAIAIIVAVIAFGSVSASLTDVSITGSFSAAGNSTISRAGNMFYSGMSIAGVTIIMLAGSSVVLLVFSLRGFGRPPQRPRDRF
jgi:uncharacterized protein (UPF0333 family)